MLGLILNPLKSSRVCHVLTKSFWGNKQTTVTPYPRETSLKYRFIFSSVMSKIHVFVIFRCHWNLHLPICFLKT